MKKHLVLITILLISTAAVAQTTEPSILIIYNDESDLSSIMTFTSGLPGSYTSISIESISVSDISDQDLIIFVSSAEFNTEDTIDNAIKNYIDDPSHHFLVISPYIDDFSDDLEESLGIESVDTIESSGGNLTWTIEVKQNFGNLSIGDQFSYDGIAAMLELTSQSQQLAAFTAVSNDEDIEFPKTAVWNNSVAAPVFGIATTLNTTSSNLQLDQFTDFISTFIKQIITIMLNIIANDTSSPTDNTNDTSGSNQTTDDPANFSIPDFTPPQLGIIAILTAFILVLLTRIRSIIDWIIRRVYGVLIFVVGAFYNIQDRTLSHNEVMMNISRIKIIEFLEHVGSYGAHLREIKAVTDLGSGSLLWHLQMLEDYGIIDKYSIGKYTIFVADGFTFDFELKQVELQLQSKYTLDLLEAMIEGSKLHYTLTEIEISTGISRRSLRRLLNKFADLELIQIEKYPEMSLEILDENFIRDLLHSFRLRSNFAFDENNPRIDIVEDS